MSDESRHHRRAPRFEEKELLAALLGLSLEAIDEKLRTSIVEDMADGGMGSIRFVPESGESRSFDKAIAEAEYVDADGVTVSIAVNADERGDLYEVDFWKVDFSPLCEYPKPAQLRIKTKESPPRN
jgi:hypothetical protein